MPTIRIRPVNRSTTAPRWLRSVTSWWSRSTYPCRRIRLRRHGFEDRRCGESPEFTGDGWWLRRREWDRLRAHRRRDSRRSGLRVVGAVRRRTDVGLRRSVTGGSRNPAVHGHRRRGSDSAYPKTVPLRYHGTNPTPVQVNLTRPGHHDSRCMFGLHRMPTGPLEDTQFGVSLEVSQNTRSSPTYILTVSRFAARGSHLCAVGGGRKSPQGDAGLPPETRCADGHPGPGATTSDSG